MIASDTTSADRRYTTAISKGTAMADEMRRLLAHWRPEESLDDFAKRVHEQGLLGGATAYRTGDVVRRVFAPRLLRPTDKPARTLKSIMEKRLAARTFTELLFLFACRFDPLIFDFTVREYWPAVRRGKTVLTVQEGIDFLNEAHLDGRLENEWSESVTRRISRALLGILRDVGFLRGDTGKKEIVPYEVTDHAVAVLARDLHEAGVSDGALAAHPDWGLFGLQGSRPLEILERMGDSAGVVVQRAGEVVRLTWRVDTMEELIDVLAR